MNKKSHAGWVYVLTHEAMPGVVKVDQTRQKPWVRLRDINQALGVTPDLPGFEIAALVQSKGCCAILEQRVHDALSHKRVRQDREFFVCSPEEVVDVLVRLGGTHVALDGSENWPIPRPPKLSPSDRNRFQKDCVRGGGFVYLWMHYNYEALKGRVSSVSFSWVELAFDVAKAKTKHKPEQPLRVMSPDVVRQTWERVVSGIETFGYNRHRWINPGSENWRRFEMTKVEA